MCDPMFWMGMTAAQSAAAGGAFVATSGLFGAAGAFSISATLGTLGAVGTAMSLFSAGEQKAENYQYQAHLSDYQAQIDENNVLAAQYSAEYDRQKFADMYKRQVISRQGPKYAASGVVINQDTPGLIADEAFREGKLEELAILYKGKTTATAARQKSLAQKYASVNYRINAENARTAGYIGAGTSLLSAFS